MAGSRLEEEAGGCGRDISELRTKLREGGIHPEKTVPDRKERAQWAQKTWWLLQNEQVEGGGDV